MLLLFNFLYRVVAPCYGVGNKVRQLHSTDSEPLDQLDNSLQTDCICYIMQS